MAIFGNVFVPVIGLPIVTLFNVNNEPISVLVVSADELPTITLPLNYEFED